MAFNNIIIIIIIILIGKTFWKGVALPSILMGNQVVNLNLTQERELQTIENGVYRKILGGGPAVLETMRGDIGASLMESRLMENKILFVKSIIEGNNELMKEIIKKMRRDEDNAKKKNEEKERKYKEKLRNTSEENEKRTKAKAKKEKGNSWMEKLD